MLFTLALGPYLSTPIRFIWNCFLKPLGKGHDDQSQVLDAFYAGQADVYDATRTHLLKGREDMLQLLASHLKAQPAGITGAGGAAAKPKIWVDIGGGTGWNIEKMWVEIVSTGSGIVDHADARDEYLPISYFDAVYLVDLCEPLLEVARQRFKARGWKNVHVLHQDASAFVLPEWENGAVDPRGSVTAITLSYSLSMVSFPGWGGGRADFQIPPFYQLLDRCDQVLDRQRGLMGVVDFYTSRDGGRKERVSTKRWAAGAC